MRPAALAPDDFDVEEEAAALVEGQRDGVVFEQLRAGNAEIDDGAHQIGVVYRTSETMLDIDLDEEQIIVAADRLDGAALRIDRKPAKELVQHVEHQGKGRKVYKTVAVVQKQHQQTRNHDLMEIKKEFPKCSPNFGNGLSDHQKRTR